MAEESDEGTDKTEEPSQKKLDEARQHGQVAHSREIAHWFMILASGIVVIMISPSMGHQLYDNLVGLWLHPHEYSFEKTNIGDFLSALLYQTIGVMLLPFVLFIIAACLSSIIQFGLLFSPDHITPKLERISIMKGFKRIFSMRSVVELVKGIFKIMIVGAVIFFIIKPIFDDSPNFIHYEMGSILLLLKKLVARVLMVTVAVITFIAALDWLYQRLSFYEQMKMSKQELKDEYRQSEGDPIVKQRMRQIRADKARKRMMAAVPKSTVVVTNPTHYAVALLFEINTMETPKVVAKGVDVIAQRIRTLAEDNKVPIIESPPLARALYASVEVDEDIPMEYYKAVAEIISYVLKLKKTF